MFDDPPDIGQPAVPDADRAHKRLEQAAAIFGPAFGRGTQTIESQRTVAPVEGKKQRQQPHERRAVRQLTGDNGVLPARDVAVEGCRDNGGCRDVAVIGDSDDDEWGDVGECETVELGRCSGYGCGVGGACQ